MIILVLAALWHFVLWHKRHDCSWCDFLPLENSPTVILHVQRQYVLRTAHSGQIMSYTLCRHTHAHTRTCAHTDASNVLSLSIAACDGWRGQSRENVHLVSDRQDPNPLRPLNMLRWETVCACVCTYKVCVCVCHMRLSACLTVCSPKVRQHVCTHSSYGNKVLFCHEAGPSDITSHYKYNVDGLAVRTHALLEVKRSDSLMIAHICHIASGVQIWTWCKSYALRRRTDTGIQTRKWSSVQTQDQEKCLQKGHRWTRRGLGKVGDKNRASITKQGIIIRI